MPSCPLSECRPLLFIELCHHGSFGRYTLRGDGHFYEVSEIAESIKRKPLKVLHSLRRLEQKEKVQCLNVNESASGLWGLHSLER
jgi:hypothetical protein